ncbi:hypothetical protein HK405_013735 [Cladochytrium tenue]|nr:hypothetical protein HK405_013735 [Cladochytrium tenue]
MAATTTSAITAILGRKRRAPAVPWETLAQPVPLVSVKTEAVSTGPSSAAAGASTKPAPKSHHQSIRYVATGVTPEAEAILTQLPAPLSIVAFTGFGRSGKSFTATRMRAHLAGDATHVFASQPGNVPCTHGIDMAVFRHPRGQGHIVFLDCEGGANHNQTAIPFVIGLAARLSSRMYIFERGCFTTAGLDTVMQVVNMGYATSADDVDITRSIVLCENMSINADVPAERLLEDLLSCEEGDEMTNRVRMLVREKFDVQFQKLPYDVPVPPGEPSPHDEACREMASRLLDGNSTGDDDTDPGGLAPFIAGGVPADGTAVVQLCNELVAQIRDGGSRFNMVTATEALVANMASEAANAVWADFVERVRRQGNHPSQVSGRKPLRAVLREVEGAANRCLNDLDAFTSRLVPSAPAAVARHAWDRNLANFEADVRAAHQRRAEEMARYSQWADRANRLVQELVVQVVEAVRQLVKFARFSTTLILLSNYYLWKHSVTLVTGIAQGVLSPA